jgi:hypothetical protein
MKRIYFILATAVSIAFTSCTNEEIVGGEEQGTEQALTDAITFGGNAGKLTRATSNTGTVAQMLDGHFKVYGVKKVGSTWKSAFTDYIVWSTNAKTETNPDADWDYVGTTSQTYGADNTALAFNQTTKYWDYSASEYHFVAGSPASAFTFNLNNDKDIISATVTGLAGHINPNPTSGTGTALATAPVYIATPVIVAKTNYKQDVEFTFIRQQTFVRVGVFETIPGYSIKDIEFYTQGENGWVAPTGDNKNNIILASTTASYFSGTQTADATITYTWTGDGAPKFTYAYNTAALTQQKNWYGGKLDGVKAITSTETDKDKLFGTDKDMASTGYFTVIPMSASVAQPILVKCNYTLLAEDGKGEEITVTGATAAIPAAFALWKPNTTYTYLFKISQNTNGTTGNPNNTDDPEGLFPISFDATVIAEAEGTTHGFITSVTTPNITTYQAGSVTDEGIKYVSGKAIYLTAQDDETGNLLTLTDGGATIGAVQVYKLTGAATEADLQLTAPTGTDLFTLGSSDVTFDKVDFVANKHGYFTPSAAGYYAIQYLIKAAAGTEPAAYAYKIVKVE